MQVQTWGHAVNPSVCIHMHISGPCPLTLRGMGGWYDHFVGDGFDTWGSWTLDGRLFLLSQSAGVVSTDRCQGSRVIMPIYCSMPMQMPPSPSMSPEDSVRIQLDALIRNNEPWCAFLCQLCRRHWSLPPQTHTGATPQITPPQHTQTHIHTRT